MAAPAHVMGRARWMATSRGEQKTDAGDRVIDAVAVRRAVTRSSTRMEPPSDRG